MSHLREVARKDRSRIILLLILAGLFLSALQGMPMEDWLITLLRGLAVGAIIFLVAAGLSLILGLMDVLNLAHGELFMLGAYLGWTVYVRPDTFVDLLTPLALLAAGLLLIPVWQAWLGRLHISSRLAGIWPWAAILAAAGVLLFILPRFPLAIWNWELYAESPIANAMAFSQGTLNVGEPPTFENIAPVWGLLGALLGSLLLGLSLAGFNVRRQAVADRSMGKGRIFGAVALMLFGLLLYWGNDVVTEGLFQLSSTWLFFLAMVVAVLSGFMLGVLVESLLIRPLYDRPIYQIMLTLGIGFILIEVVRTIWGRPGFTMPKPELFAGRGDGCPATSLGDLLAHHCSTILLFDGRIRTYNEIFVILVGLIVLTGVWLLLKRTRIGMIIRAGVQDREMVEALGINVHLVFNFVFALGVGLAALGGVLAAPSIGLSPAMGANFLLLALIALAIGGLTSFPGAAAGAVLVGLLQQFIIKYGQIGIPLPFLDEPFKPTPPLVPASTILLMVIVLLVVPQGLFGQREG